MSATRYEGATHTLGNIAQSRDSQIDAFACFGVDHFGTVQGTRNSADRYAHHVCDIAQTCSHVWIPFVLQTLVTIISAFRVGSIIFDLACECKRLYYHFHETDIKGFLMDIAAPVKASVQTKQAIVNTLNELGV